jgi:hypothetical protein
MNSLRNITSTLLYILISLLLLSCGASHHLRDNVVYIDDDFSYNHLRNNGIIIGGVSSQLINLSVEDRMKYSSLLSNKMLESLKDAYDIQLMNTLQFVHEIGKENYLEIMDNYDQEKTIEKETIHLIRDTIPNVKYILFAYIENENIIDKSFDKYIENKDGEKELQTKYKKTYLLAIEFQIYDLLQEKMVWNNLIYNEAKQTETRTTQTGCVEGCIDNLFQTILFGEPAEIDREEVLAKIFEKFAENLTKTKH